MVHALQECWRVLVPGGQLIDMRPRASKPHVELVLNDALLIAGQLDDSHAEVDYIAADRAMRTTVAHGLFTRQEERQFSFAYYWPILEQMETYITENWGDFAILAPQVVQRARALSPEDRPVNYRVREVIMITDYRKRPGVQPARGTD
jgi:hypothetical protein